MSRHYLMCKDYGSSSISGSSCSSCIIQPAWRGSGENWFRELKESSFTMHVGGYRLSHGCGKVAERCDCSRKSKSTKGTGMASSYGREGKKQTAGKHSERHEDCIPLIDCSLIASIRVYVDLFFSATQLSSIIALCSHFLSLSLSLSLFRSWRT